MAIQWKESYSVGIDKVDEQHKELFNRINMLLDACSKGQAKTEVGKVLDFLQAYVIDHFGDEEKLMNMYSYPSYATHKKMHEQFVKDFIDLKNDFSDKGSSPLLILRTNKVVIDWLMKHITTIDVKLGEFLNKKMVAK